MNHTRLRAKPKLRQRSNFGYKRGISTHLYDKSVSGKQIYMNVHFNRIVHALDKEGMILHREDGPALKYFDNWFAGTYWLYGIQFTKYDWEQAVSKMKIKYTAKKTKTLEV